MLHLALHLLVPLLISLLFFRSQWLKSLALMLLALLIDLDHLLADPIYDPGRCSMGFHPLHTPIPVLIYVLALLHRRTRVLGIGLCVHVILDSLDCYATTGAWIHATSPLANNTAMTLNSIITLLIVGALAGWLASHVLRSRGFGPRGNIIAGVVGALVAGFGFGVLGILPTDLFGSVISATIGAALLIGLGAAFKKI